MVEIIDGKINYGQPLLPGNKRKWERTLSPRTVRQVEEIAFDTMTLLGYEPVLADRARPMGALSRAWGHLHDLAAMVLVGNRYSTKNGLSARVSSVRFELKKRRV